MLDLILSLLDQIDGALWTYFGFTGIVTLGLWFTLKSKFVQIPGFMRAIRYIKAHGGEEGSRGISPIRTFFAAVGGAVGIGNIVGICTAVQIGGPGAVFWIWMVAFIGVLLKYMEVYLGMKYRQADHEGGYDGGPMYYLPKAFNYKWVPTLCAGLLCVYGVEIYQFHVIVDSISGNWGAPPLFVSAALLLLVLYAARGGIQKLGYLASRMIPILVTFYLLMTGYILIINLQQIPHVFALIFKSAFTGHAAIGGFVGSSFWLTASQGIARGCYASDIGIGYTSIIHSDSSEKDPVKQASLTFLGVLIDLFGVCTLSMLLILVTGIWSEPDSGAIIVQRALELYFPHMSYYMPFLIFLLGYSTVLAFFVVGLRCAKYLSPRYGEKAFYLYGTLMLTLFTFIPTHYALTIMSICGVTLLIINLLAFWKLRNQVKWR